MHSSLFVAVAALLAVSRVEAFWRMPCGNSLVIERADSIVSPGAVSGHVHNILGGSNFALGTSFEALRKSECTSCVVKQDLSNYWTPQLYFHWANGSFSSVETTGGALIYYLQRSHPTDKTNITAFPDGLRMLTGNPFKRSYNSSSLTAQAIGWNCLGSGVEDTRQPYLPPYNCPDGLRGEIRFPSCWDGKNLDSTDHSSHMAYPEDNETGPCPATHPVRLVTLFYEIMWSIDPWKDVRSQGLDPDQPFVLAMGDKSGYGFHGDFFNGWDRAVLQNAIDYCTDDSGEIEYCQQFDLQAPGYQCHQTPQVNEVVLGTLPKLPGCNPVTGEGPDATPCTESPAPSLLQNAVYTGSVPPAGIVVPGDEPIVLMNYTSKSGSKWAYQDCYSDLVNGRALPTQLSTTAKTIQACLEACTAGNYKLCSVQYHGECWAGNTLGAGSMAQGADFCTLTCTDNPLQYCGGSGTTIPAYMELYARSDSKFVYTKPIPTTTTTISTTRRTTTSHAKTTTTPYTSTSRTTTTTTTRRTTTATTSHSSTASASPAVTVPVSTSTSRGATTSSSSSTSSVRPTTTTTTTRTTTTPTSPKTTTTTTSTRTRQVWYIATTTSSRSSSTTTTSVKPTTTSARTSTTTTSSVKPTTTTTRAASTTSSAKPTTTKIVWYVAPLTSSSTHAVATTTTAVKAVQTTSAIHWYVAPLSTASVQAAAVATGAARSLAAASSADLLATKTSNDSSWIYQGCYPNTTTSGSPLLSANLTLAIPFPNRTISSCLAAASSANLSLAGLLNGGECWASEPISFLPSALLVSECNALCSGNSTATCGGDGRFDLYLRNETAASASEASHLVARSRVYEKRKAQVRNKAFWR
ncbi:hypothetical protein JCM8547_001225 [Rhodosporidiobolus lusitaniae]